MKSIRFARVLLQEFHYFILIAVLFVTVLHGYETKVQKTITCDHWLVRYLSSVWLITQKILR